jgi:biopolymer transport protein TolR
MRPRRLKNEINVVPYIDVMLVLLVIFMVTAPMMTTASIDVPSVGESGTAASRRAASEYPRERVPDAAGAGRQRNTGDSSQLPKEIRAAQASNPELAVVIVGDRSVKYEAVLKVMDELQRNEVKRIGLLVQLTDK